MPRRLTCVAAFVVACAAVATGQTTVYFPERFDWQRRTPAQAGLDAAALADAITFAVANENPAPKDLARAHAQGIGASEPFDTPIGPFKERGATNGLIVKNGYVVAEWGDPARVDMTFSVTKTFLSTVVGLAVAEGVDPQRRRQGARLHAAGRRSVRGAAQSDDHVGSSPAPDQRLAGHALGQARLGGSAGGQAGRVGEPDSCMSPAPATNTTTCA